MSVKVGNVSKLLEIYNSLMDKWFETEFSEPVVCITFFKKRKKIKKPPQNWREVKTKTKIKHKNLGDEKDTEEEVEYYNSLCDIETKKVNDTKGKANFYNPKHNNRTIETPTGFEEVINKIPVYDHVIKYPETQIIFCHDEINSIKDLIDRENLIIGNDNPKVTSQLKTLLRTHVEFSEIKKWCSQVISNYKNIIQELTEWRRVVSSVTHKPKIITGVNNVELKEKIETEESAVKKLQKLKDFYNLRIDKTNNFIFYSDLTYCLKDVLSEAELEDLLVFQKEYFR